MVRHKEAWISVGSIESKRFASNDILPCLYPSKIRIEGLRENVYHWHMIYPSSHGSLLNKIIFQIPEKFSTSDNHVLMVKSFKFDWKLLISCKIITKMG